jgi:hypothetical protein
MADRWAHYAHCKQILVKVGDHVKKGQKIAILGGTGTKPGHPDVNAIPHLHFEIWRIDPKIPGYNYYPYGLSRAQVDQIYENPQGYRTNEIPTKFDHYGYNYLDKVDGANVYHPGQDLNGPGQDLGQPEYACFDGVVQWIGLNINGWGNHFYIKREVAPAPVPTPPNGDNEMIYLNNWSDGDFNKFLDMVFFKGNFSYTGPKNKEEWLKAYGNMNLWELLEKGHSHKNRANFGKKLENSFASGKQWTREDFYNPNIDPNTPPKR